MFWDLDGWLEVDDDEVSTLVHALNAFFTKSTTPSDSDAQPFLIVRRAKDSRELAGHTAQLIVRRVRRRHLPFYRNDWRLLEFTCDVTPLLAIPGYRRQLVGYEDDARLFALCGPNQPSEDWILINWTSSQIYEANEGKASLLDLATQPAEVAREYLIFFCSFLGAEPDVGGAIAPFLVPQDENVLLKDAIGSLDDVGIRDLSGVSMPAIAEDADPFDLGQPDGESAQENTQGSGAAIPAQHKNIQSEVRRAFAAFGANPRRIPGDGMRFEILVWYAGVLFKSVVSVVPGSGQNAPPGFVQMLEDEPIVGDVPLPVPRFEVRELPSGVRLLCRQKRREEISGHELLRRIARIEKSADDFDNSTLPAWQVSAGLPADRLRVLRVMDAGEIRFPQNVAVSLILDDIEFVGAVNLDDSVFEHSLAFLNCRFLQSLSARDTTIKGSFSLEGSRIDGMTRDTTEEIGGAQPAPAVALESLKVERSFLADRLQVHGRIRCQWMHIGGALRAQGIRVHPRSDRIDGSDIIDLSHAVIEGPLDLSSQPKTGDRPGSDRRTRFDGNCLFQGLHAALVKLTGARMHSLDLTACRIDRTLDATPITYFTTDTKSRPGWRTRIEGDLNLARGEAGFIDLSGALILHNLWVIEHQLKGSLHAGIEERYRTRVGETVLLSGSRIDGDVELGGSQIDAELHFITGSCGRLRAGVEWWTDDEGKKDPIKKLCGTEISGLYFQDVTIAGGLHLIGITLHGRKPDQARGGVSTFNVRVGGAIGFWDANRSKTLNNLSKVEDASVKQTIRSVEARLEGDLDLTGVCADGGIDLSRTWIKGRIALDNSRIGQLFAYEEDEDDQNRCGKKKPEKKQAGKAQNDKKVKPTCSCECFTMNTARIAGDVDLRGLEIREAGDLIAREVKVDGVFRLATEGSTEPSSPHASLKNGRIDLQGIVVPQLVMSADNIQNFGGSTPEKPLPAMRLTRARIGQLCLGGFKPEGAGKSRFPRTLDLTAIEVGDWGIKPDPEAIPVLDATWPEWHDGRNYIDIEGRLAGIGETKLANEVYRLLVRRRARGFLGNFVYRLLQGFSGNGTRPLLMFAWLLVLTIPVFFILSDYRNVEFVDKNQDWELESEWNATKAARLTLSYAVPILGSAPSEPVRARFVGASCFPGFESRLSLDGQKTLPCPTIWKSSPHDFVLTISVVQLGLWFLLAGSLPSIFRRRT